MLQGQLVTLLWPYATNKLTEVQLLEVFKELARLLDNLSHLDQNVMKTIWQSGRTLM